MNVLYITYDGLQDPLGQSQIIPCLRELHHTGVEYSIISFEKSFPDSSFKQRILSFSKEWKQLSFYKRKNTLAVLFSLFQCFFFGCVLILKSKIQVIHCRSYVSSFIGLLLKSIFRKKFIFDARGFWVDERVEIGNLRENSLEYRVWKLIEKKLYSSADQIIVLTYTMKKELGIRGVSLEKITVIPTRVDLQLFDSIGSTKEKEFTLVYQGSLGTRYLFKEMLEFHKALREQIRDAKFLVLTPMIDQITEEWRKKLRKQGVIFSSAAHADVPKYLRKSMLGICFVLPGFAAKGVSMTKIGEYLASGIPIVVNKGIGDYDLDDSILKKYNIGVLVENFSNSEYRRAVQELISLLKDKKIQQTCRKAARREFSLEEGVKKYQQVYEQFN